MSARKGGLSACHELAPLLPELALGMVGGHERETALGHLGDCPVCSIELEQLSAVADGLLAVAPECDPPVGFEVTLVGRLRREPEQPDRGAGWAAHARVLPRRRAVPRRRLRGRPELRRALAVAAVVLAVGLAFGGGWLARAATKNPPARNVRAPMATASLLEHGRRVGTLWIDGGHPPSLAVSVEDLSGPGTVRCQVTTTAGHTENVGTFTLSAGYGSWSAPLRVAPGSVVGARLIDDQGQVVASAQVSHRR